MATGSKLKASKPSKVVKPKKNPKFSTATTRKHRFQPFSERIAKLKIDPIRRRRDAQEREELSDDTATYFGRSLREWVDLNLSQTFTRFVKEAAPLCDSLPMVLHNENVIMDLLVKYIDMQDALALEPLLNLLSHFAHDLDARFEQHFKRAVATVASVAAQHEDPAVVEWCFTCLAWLFKYLSRLLIPDLRPLYDLMSPYLGTRVRKPFIIRFAAESMSFLVRKAATAYEREPAFLDKIIGHMFDTCAAAPDGRMGDLQRQGIMTLITEATKGVQGGIHSNGVAILESTLVQARSRTSENLELMKELVSGILTSIIHYTDAAAFSPIQQAVVKCVASFIDAKESASTNYAAELLLTITSVRKGTRVSDWNSVLAALKKLAESAEDLAEDPEDSRRVLVVAVAVALQTAHIDVVLQNLDMLKMVRTTWSRYFLSFSDLFARLGAERFQSFLLPEFQKYILEQCNDDVDQMCLLVNRFDDLGIDTQLSCPENLQDRLLEVGTGFTKLEEDRQSSELKRAGLVLTALRHFKLTKQRKERLCKILLSLVERCLLQCKTERPNDSTDFALSVGFETLLAHSADDGPLLELWPLLCTQSSHFVSLPLFWSNLLQCVKQISGPELEAGNEEHINALYEPLIQCLATPSHETRQAALHILRRLKPTSENSMPTALDTASLIESTPISLDTSRTISMNIRRLGSEHGEDAQLQRSITSYCFGIMHFKLSQAWADAINVLMEMSKSTAGDEIATRYLQAWLEALPQDQSDNEQDEAFIDANSSGFNTASDFECSNFAKINAIAAQALGSLDEGKPLENDQASGLYRRVFGDSEHLREQALRIMYKLPKLAEKRSRMLVPILLNWAANAHLEADDESRNIRYSRKHQKMMLSVFSQFTNPRVLYRSSEVYSALLNLCAHGDVEIQTSAFTAVLSWKNQAVNKYEEHLKNLLDEARFRDEVSVFLQDGNEDGLIHHSEDFPTLMPVLLRLLYGRAVAGGKHGQSSRRKAIYDALSRFGEDVMSMFADIIIEKAGQHPLMSQNRLNEESLESFTLPPRQQLGMLNMIHDLLETVGPAVEPLADKLIDALLICTIRASRKLENASDKSQLQDTSLLRSVRQVGLQSLVLMFSSFQQIDLSEKAEVIVTELIAPRLEKLASENTESISSLLRLLSAWSTSARTAQYLVAYNDTVIGQMEALFSAPNTKNEVRIFILRDFLDNLLRDGMGDILTEMHVSGFVRGIGAVLKQQPSTELLQACVTSFTLLADSISSEEEAQEVITVCTGMLTKSNKEISPGTKAGLLRTMLPLVDNFGTQVTPSLYLALCSLFSRMKSQDSRTLLSTVFCHLCAADPELSQSAEICADMNSLGQMDEPDHERRERGFTAIFEQHAKLSSSQWRPIVHNCLFYIQDADDMVNRSSASQALRRFIDSTGQDDENKQLIQSAVIPGIEYGMKERSELVRSEYLQLFGHLVSSFPEWPILAGMQSLTVDGDEEASVFNNILNIQQHRRLRALRRLGEDAAKLSSNNVNKIFLPLLEHFVFDPAEGDAGRTLADQTIITIGSLSTALSWSALRATFKRYTGLIKTDDAHEKVILRLLSSLADAMRNSSKNIRAITDAERAERITSEFLPPLMEYIHQKDESTVDRRLGVAVTIIKLLTLLPAQDMSVRLTPVLTDVSHILRSRSVEARDQTRKTLASALSVIGPAYFGFLLKELRSALQRGYQLHVLSFTVHSLLVHSLDKLQPGDLDHCLSGLTVVIMDDIFGITGQEKDAEEYKSGMKEVKSSKSYDTMELLARITPVRRLGQLIEPIQALLSEKLDSATLKKIDELLLRVRKGVDQNPDAESRDTLVFCHEIVRLIYAKQDEKTSRAVGIYQKPSRYLVAMQPYSNKKAKASETTNYRFKLVTFALDLLRRIIRRYDDLLTPANLSGFLPVTGDALLQGQEEVRVSALKLLSSIMKLQIPELDSNAPVYLDEAVKLIKGAPSMTADIAKASLELITAILREKRSIRVRDTDIASVLKALKPDIDEPDRQGIIYRFLRAVIGHKIMATEVYEIMDEVSQVVVTNPDRQVRESARSAYLQFILDYPQGSDRWSKQIAYLVENLKYEHPAGRQSIMELLHQLLIKLGDKVLDKLNLTLFVALVPVQTSDEEQSCRQMATILIGKIFERASEAKFATLLSLTNTWLQNEGNPTIRTAALQCWQTILRTRPPGKQHIEALRETLVSLLDADAVDEADATTTEQCLKTVMSMVETESGVAFAKSSTDVWLSIQEHVGSPHLEVKVVAAKLLEAYFSDFARTNAKTEEGLSALPMKGSHGLALDAEDMRRTCRSSLRALQTGSHEIDEDFAGQIVRHLVFVGRCFAANGMVWANSSVNDDLDEEEEEEQDGDATESHKDKSALGYLFNRLAYLVRQDRLSTISRSASMHCLLTLVNLLSTVPRLESLLRSLYLLTDLSIPQPPGEAHRNITDKAHELLDLVQKKVGSETYLKALGVARTQARERRDERRQKRRVEAVSAPERWAREKKKKYAHQKAKAKAKSAEARGRRREW